MPLSGERGQGERGGGGGERREERGERGERTPWFLLPGLGCFHFFLLHAFFATLVANPWGFIVQGYLDSYKIG